MAFFIDCLAPFNIIIIILAQLDRLVPLLVLFAGLIYKAGYINPLNAL